MSNTQAKAEVEARQTMQRIMITIRLRTLVPLLEPTQNHIAECPNLDRPRLVVIDGGPEPESADTPLTQPTASGQA